METPPTIMLVEDEFLVGLDMADQIQNAGFLVSGPFTHPSPALDAIAQAPPQAAVLDINLGANITSEPVALDLRERSIPFVFITGYSEYTPKANELSNSKRLTKPCPPDTLIRELQELLGLDQ